MEEVWNLYNEKREKISCLLQRGKPIPKGYYHLVVSTWIMNSQGQYLLSQRHPDKQYPFYWECTGGSVLVGESSLEGAIREVKEELGIALDPTCAELIHQTRWDSVQDFYDVWLFRADVDISEIRLQQSEVINVKWVNLDILLDMFQSGKLHPPIDYIEQICD